MREERIAKAAAIAATATATTEPIDTEVCLIAQGIRNKKTCCHTGQAAFLTAAIS